MTSEPPPDGSASADRRAAMVARDIAGRGVRDPRVLAAMRTVPRERFVPADLRDSAYFDHPLPIGDGQTISQPFIVAMMAEAALPTPTDRILEIGTGSGYGAAVLREVSAAVITIERHATLAERARRDLEACGYGDVEVVVGDGSLGWPAGAPYDAIVVTAAGPLVPPTLLEQLTDGGRLVMPVGPERDAQEMVRVTRRGDEYVRESLGDVRFVPLIGEEGF